MGLTYWDKDGNEIGWGAALKFQTAHPVKFEEMQKARRAAGVGLGAGLVKPTKDDKFGRIRLTGAGQITAPKGGGSVRGVRASVETSGSKSIASRRTMMRTVTPMAVLGQKKIQSDTRQCFLIIEGVGWAVTESVPARKEKAAREFAAKVNAAAAAAGPADAPDAAPAEVDVAEQIDKLAALRDRRILTEEEFSSKKAELLARI